jgi:hypothetical protein
MITAPAFITQKRGVYDVDVTDEAIRLCASNASLCMEPAIMSPAIMSMSGVNKSTAREEPCRNINQILP